MLLEELLHKPKKKNPNKQKNSPKILHNHTKSTITKLMFSKVLLVAADWLHRERDLQQIR